jgi:hypothetical protein
MSYNLSTNKAVSVSGVTSIISGQPSLPSVSLEEFYSVSFDESDSDIYGPEDRTDFGSNCEFNAEGTVNYIYSESMKGQYFSISGDKKVIVAKWDSDATNGFKYVD